MMELILSSGCHAQEEVTEDEALVVLLLWKSGEKGSEL